MLFVTVAYFAFFAIVLGLFYLGPAAWRRRLLLAASYFFYASWNWKFVPLLLLLTIIDYYCAFWIAREGSGGKRVALAVSLTANLGFLGVFKYSNFLGENLALILHRPVTSFFWDVVLPLGISFHTFQSISYVVDVYRGNQRPVRSFIDYALFIAFFPQLVAGPIVRAATFFPDLWRWRAPSLEDVKRGSLLLALGLVKKLVMADNFAAISDEYFGAIGAHPGALWAWGGDIAFALQIFFDFSGYSDMAIGSALLLGFHFPANFRQPFLAITVTDFWRRWHISLSTWLRDYLYIPLGGSRGGTWSACRNLMITMALCGLWHGARWGFVIWGAFNGLMMTLERLTGLNKIRDRPFRWTDIPAAAVTFALFCLGVVFVRANTIADALRVFGNMWRSGQGIDLEPAILVLTCCSLVLALLADRGLLREWLEGMPYWATGCIAGGLLFLAETFGQHQHRPFYYFQF
jgi:alginate O-acetyltransferase complex protein AlgI